MASRLTDIMPIAIALAMGAIATEFILPASSTDEVIRELALDKASLEVELTSFPPEHDETLARGNMPAPTRALRRESE